MPCLYVTENSSTVRLSGQSLLVTSDANPLRQESPQSPRRQNLMEVEAHRLEMIGLVGRVHITSDALYFCLENGIGVAWFAWNSKYLGRLVPPCPRSADLRLHQYAAVRDDAVRLAWARRIVDTKLLNCLEVLQDIRSNDSSNAALAEAVDALRTLRARAAACDSTERLLGVEGMAARTYFQALGTAFRAEIDFKTRERCPPPDPANALLSFGYVLLGNRLGGMLEARGLDPALGFFHEVSPPRPSVALDLLEEFRAPVVDRFVLRACNLRALRKEMFEPDDQHPGGVKLNRDGLKIFFQEWERHLLRPLREQHAASKIAVLPLLERQIERLAADLRGREPYQPFLYGG
jgi:CRISPR-associated protein Cas1